MLCLLVRLGYTEETIRLMMILGKEEHGWNCPHDTEGHGDFIVWHPERRWDCWALAKFLQKRKLGNICGRIGLGIKGDTVSTLGTAWFLPPM